jgi:DNA-binding response OmpR family regulator
LVERTILIVDENPSSRTFLANRLGAKQFKILEAPTGKEGLIVAWSYEPDLALFDTALRDISEKEFIQKLRNESRTEKAHVVVADLGLPIGSIGPIVGHDGQLNLARRFQVR